jgi:uncharacterized repeat protein (TIGR01451 family)
MTHFNTESRSQTQGRQARDILGAWRLLLTTSLLVAASSAAAQVALENTVQKVETFVNEAGEPQRRLVDADSVVPGDELRYTITFANKGPEVVDAGSIVITNPIPPETTYLDGTAFGSGTEIDYSVDGENFGLAEALTISQGDAEVIASAKDYQSIRWVFQPALEPGETGNVSFSVRLK